MSISINRVLTRPFGMARRLINDRTIVVKANNCGVIARVFCFVVALATPYLSSFADGSLDWYSYVDDWGALNKVI